MTVLSKLKKEYGQAIDFLIKSSICMSKIIDLNRQLSFLSCNKRTISVDINKINYNNKFLQKMQKNIDNLIEEMETQLFTYLEEESENVDIFVDSSARVRNIFREDFEDSSSS